MTVSIEGTTPGIAVDGTGAVVNVTVTTGDGGGGGGVTDHGLLTGLSDDDHTQYAKKASNLSDLASAATARTNLGLGTAAVGATGDFDAAGTAAGLVDDLSGVSNQATARTNLGLGSAAVEAASAFATAAQGVDARTPTSHASSHAAAGSDPVTLAQSQVTNLTTDLAGKVASSDIDQIDVVTQAEYDALTPPDDRTFYVISDGASAGGGAATLPTFSIDPMVTAVTHTGWATFGILSNAWNNWNRYSSGTLNDLVVFRLPGSLEAGTWTITIGHLRSTNAGIYTFAHSVDGSTWTSHGTTIDGYNGSISAQRSELTGVTIPDGTQYVRLRMTAKNASSSSYVGWLNFIGGLRTGA